MSFLLVISFVVHHTKNEWSGFISSNRWKVYQRSTWNMFARLVGLLFVAFTSVHAGLISKHVLASQFHRVSTCILIKIFRRAHWQDRRRIKGLLWDWCLYGIVLSWIQKYTELHLITKAICRFCFAVVNIPRVSEWILRYSSKTQHLPGYTWWQTYDLLLKLKSK